MWNWVRKFDVLISCPSDIQKELKVIKDVVDNFNSGIGDANGIILQTKHWETDSFAQSGGSPQDLLNEQIVLNSHAVIAVLWTRFGSPTEKYGSGTEEEVELLLEQGKQVFLYFSDIPSPPSEQDSEQSEKVKKFKKKYEDRGIYKIYGSLEEFNKHLTNDLNMYFLSLIKEKSDSINFEGSNKQSNLSVKGIYNKELVDNLTYFNSELLKSNFIAERNKEIKKMIHKINVVDLPPPVVKSDVYRIETDEETSPEVGRVVEEMKSKVKPLGIQSSFKRLFEEIEISFSENEKESLRDFLTNEEIDVDLESFFNIGSLTKTKNVLSVSLPGSGSTYTYNGSEEEEEKYNLLKTLLKKLKEYNSWIDYFREIDSRYRLKLAITNNGKSFDEDVDIKLYIKKGSFIQNKFIPQPNSLLLEEATEILEYFYKIKPTHNIEEYNVNTLPSMRGLSEQISAPYGFTYKRSIEDLKEDFYSEVDAIFNYQHYEDEEFDILTFNTNYIKQNTNIAFPSILMFHSKVEEIDYEIISKHSPDVVEGKLTLNYSLET